jgi:sugar phosphate isomerase/epimerase
MRFGLCGKITQIEDAEQLGFEYLEVALNGIATMSEEDFQKELMNVRKSRIRVEKCNLLFPKTMSLLQQTEEQLAEMQHYLETAFTRMQQLGADLVVFGSGKSRNLPTDMPFCEGFGKLVAITRLTADIAEKFGITIAIEGLNRDETNMVNTLIEGAMLVSAVDKKNVHMVVDMFHMAKNNENFNEIVMIKDFAHAHIAIRGTRGFPVERDCDTDAFFAALRQIGYDGTMSIEGKTENLKKDALASLQIIRSYA